MPFMHVMASKRVKMETFNLWLPSMFHEHDYVPKFSVFAMEVLYTYIFVCWSYPPAGVDSFLFYSSPV